MSEQGQGLINVDVDQDLKKRKEAAHIIQAFNNEFERKGRSNSILGGNRYNGKAVALPRAGTTVSEDERLAFNLDLAAMFIDKARSALRYHQRGEIHQKELGQIIRILLDKLELLDGIPIWGSPPIVRPLRWLQQKRRELNAAMLAYHSSTTPNNPRVDEVKEALMDARRFSAEADRLELIAVSLRDFLRKHARKLRKRDSGTLSVLSEQEVFNRDNIELVAATTLGYFSEEVDNAVGRLNRVLKRAGIDEEINAEDLSLSKLKTLSQSVAQKLHPDRNIEEPQSVRSSREEDFKELGQLTEALRQLSRQQGKTH